MCGMWWWLTKGFEWSESSVAELKWYVWGDIIYIDERPMDLLYTYIVQYNVYIVSIDDVKFSSRYRGKYCRSSVYLPVICKHNTPDDDYSGSRIFPHKWFVCDID